MFVCGPQLCALVLALVAAATARPGDNDIVLPTKLDITLSGKAAEVEPKNTTKKPVQPTVLEVPVNEKYPSALLFGRTCGGTIISPSWVLTAGHCTIFSSGTQVLAGTNNTANGSGVTRRVKRHVIHPLFSVGPYWLDAEEYNISQVAASWDFLLVELADPLPLDGKTMAAATLDDQADLPAGLDVDYAGYGTNHHGGYMSHKMHVMKLSIQDNETCKSLEQYNQKDMLCAKGRPPNFDSACNGDSGSGLVDSSGRLVGVASWVEDDARVCRNGALVVFSRVSAVREWIREVTNI